MTVGARLLLRIATDHREAILQTAAKLFARKPFHEVLMDDVADQAGIAKGTIYRYFPNKEELFGALSMQYLESLSAGIAEVAASDAAPVKRLRLMIERMGAHIRERQDFFQVMQRHECDLWGKRYAEFLARRTHIREHFVGVVKAAQARGELREFDPVIAADFILGMSRSLLRFTQPTPPPAEMADLIMNVFLNGLKSHATGKDGGQA